ncbi:MAG TPA: cobalamin-independent methionine synthase II family protein [Candidatus Binataceae bacterium]|nr:cobalamin-independent methionine synthase II family protein [Candidatus Binataceae bacterium]
MKRSSERILTTHTGSLPRPDDLLPLIKAMESGKAADAAAFDVRVRSAVAEIVRKQVELGVDIVNDGEAGKPSYATYVKDRLSGFEGEAPPDLLLGIADLNDYPEYGERFRSQRAVSDLKRPACNGPVTYRNRKAVEKELDNLKAAVALAKPAEAFMSAASPGVISIFLPNTYYKTHEAYLGALADAMKTEYEAIHQAGIILQVDCPDLAMGRHIQFPNATLAEFRKNIERHVEALNHALANIPADRVRIHLCWGNYEGPHHRDVPLRDIIDIVFKVRAAGISYEAANPRHEHEWAVFKDVELPDGKLLIPGVIDSTNNFIEHPELIAQRICNVANQVGRENVIAGSDCGFATVAGFSAVDPKITWAKFQAMAEGARIASQRLW